MRHRPLALLLTAVTGGSLMLAAQPATGDPTSFGRADAVATHVVAVGHDDHVQLTPVGASGRTAIAPLPRADGTTPSVVVTSTDRGTFVRAADSDEAPTAIAGSAPAQLAGAAADLVELHLDAIARDGRDAAAHVNIVDLETGAVATRVLPADPGSGCTAATYAASDCILVPPAAYSVMAFVTTTPAGRPSTENGRTVQNVALVGTPETKVDESRTITLDARRARPLQVATPGHETRTDAQGAMMLGYRRTAANGKSFTAAMRPSFMLDNTFYLEPTKAVATGALQTQTRLRLEAPDIQLTAPGQRPLHPAYYDAVWFSDTASEFPMYDGHARLSVVDVGHATARDLAGKRLRGAIAVAERSDDLSVAEQSNAAAAAGAALVVVYNDGPGDSDDPNGTGVRLHVPTVRLDHAEGRALIGARGKVEVRGEPASPYVYDLLIKEDDRIPADLRYSFPVSRLATQIREVHGQPTKDSTFSEAAYAYQPSDTFAISTMFPFRGGPRTRTEYRIPDPDTRWTYAVSTPESTYNALFPHPPTLAMALSAPTLATYRPRERDVLPVAVAPVTPAPNPAVPVQRSGDRMRVRIDGFTDAEGNHGSAYSSDSGMATHLEVRADGTVVAATDNLPSGTVSLPAGDSRVEVEFSTDNPQDWAELSTHTDTTWSFPSSTTADAAVVTEPLILPDYDVPVDLRNRVRAIGRSVGFDLRLEQAPGAATAPITDVTMQASYDDGATWRPARVTRTRTGWRVAVDRGSGFVSLRLHAADAAGSVVDQTVVRAFYVIR